MPDVMNPMPAHDTDSPGYVQPDAIHPQVDGTHAKGVDPAHPELSNDLLEARAARVADLSDETSVGHDANAIEGAMQEHAPAAFYDSTKLATLIDKDGNP